MTTCPFLATLIMDAPGGSNARRTALRMPIVSGDKDNENRARVGTVNVR